MKKLTPVSSRLATLLLASLVVAVTVACITTPTPVAPTAVVVVADTPTPIVIVVTATPAPPLATNTAAPSTATPTAKPASTAVPPTPTPMPTAKPTSTPIPPTVAPPKPSPTPTCTVWMIRGFEKIWLENQSAQAYVGCPSAGEAGVDFTAQRFEKGVIFFTGATADFGKDAVLVLFGDTKTWITVVAPADASPAPIGAPPAGKFAPAGRIGWVWQKAADVSTRLGWAIAPEKTGKYGDRSNGAWQAFTRGNMYWIPWALPDDRSIYVVATDNPSPPGGSRADWLEFKDTY